MNAYALSASALYFFAILLAFDGSALACLLGVVMSISIYYLANG